MQELDQDSTQQINNFTNKLKENARANSLTGKVDFVMRKPTSLTTYNSKQHSIEAPSRKEILPISSKTIAESTCVVPNYKYGLGHDQTVFASLENSGNYQYRKGVFVPMTKAPVIQVKDNLYQVNPSSYEAYQANQQIPSQLDIDKNDQYRSGPGYATMKAGNSEMLDEVRNPILSNTRDNFFFALNQNSKLK